MRPAHPKGFWVDQTGDTFVWSNFDVGSVVSDGAAHATASPSGVPGNENFDPGAIVGNSTATASETILSLEVGGPPADFEPGIDAVTLPTVVPADAADKAASVLADLDIGPDTNVYLPAVAIGIPPWSDGDDLLFG